METTRVNDPQPRPRGGRVERLADILDARCVRLPLDARGKEEAVTELARLLVDAHGLEGGVERYASEVMARERISSTGIGGGIAIPHRLIAGVGGFMMAIGRSEKGVPFDTVDGKPAHLIFLLIGEQGRTAEHLKILSKLSRLLNDRSFFDALMRAPGAEELIAMIAAGES